MSNQSTKVADFLSNNREKVEDVLFHLSGQHPHGVIGLWGCAGDWKWNSFETSSRINSPNEEYSVITSDYHFTQSVFNAAAIILENLPA